MGLRQQLCEPFDGLKNETIDELEKIAENFAIGFVEWCENLGIDHCDKTTKELLEIYKKTL